MRKRSLFAVGLLIVIAMTVTACGGGTPSASTNEMDGAPESAAVSTAPAASTDTVAASNSAAPVLDGSNINNVVEELEKSGFPKVMLTKSSDANEYINNKTDGQSGSTLSCDVYFTKDDAVISAVFTAENTKVLDNSAFIKAAADYLTLCATLNYTNSNTGDIETWIQDNMKNASSTGMTKTFGDAMINMYGTTDDKGNFQAIWFEVYEAGA